MMPSALTAGLPTNCPERNFAPSLPCVTAALSRPPQLCFYRRHAGESASHRPILLTHRLRHVPQTQGEIPSHFRFAAMRELVLPLRHAGRNPEEVNNRDQSSVQAPT